MRNLIFYFKNIRRSITRRSCNNILIILQRVNVFFSELMARIVSLIATLQSHVPTPVALLICPYLANLSVASLSAQVSTICLFSYQILTSATRLFIKSTRVFLNNYNNTILLDRYRILIQSYPFSRRTTIIYKNVLCFNNSRFRLTICIVIMVD